MSSESEVVETVETIAGTQKTLVKDKKTGAVLLIGGPESVYCPKRGHEITEFVYRSPRGGEVELNLPMSRAPDMYRKAIAETVKPTETTKPSGLTAERIAELERLTLEHMKPEAPKPFGFHWSAEKKTWVE